MEVVGRALFVSKATRMSQGEFGEGSWEGKTRGVPGVSSSRTHSPRGVCPNHLFAPLAGRHGEVRELQHLPPTETFAGSLLCTVDHQLTGPWAQVQMGKGGEQRGGSCAHGRVLRRAPHPDARVPEGLAMSMTAWPLPWPHTG